MTEFKKTVIKTAIEHLEDILKYEDDADIIMYLSKTKTIVDTMLDHELTLKQLKENKK